ncbi:MAG TPA: magnesium/cobalt efflux protein, partial [Spirochaetales bacterium]|nr:magnesium/cobalt efflux protein [Spirochaetales bacterium]
MKPKGLFARLFHVRRTEGDDEDADEISSERREMIRGVQELSETTVKEVMVPRIDTVFLPIDAERDEILET